MQTFVNPLQVITVAQNTRPSTPPLNPTVPLPRKRNREVQCSTSAVELPFRKKRRLSTAKIDIIDMDIIDISSDREDPDILEI